MDDLRSARGRRDSERRINMHTKAATVRQTNTDPDDDLEATLQHYQNRATRLVYRAYDTTQNRKAEGKVILIGAIKHGIGVTTRTFLGPRQTTAKASKPKIANPTIKLKTKRKK